MHECVCVCVRVMQKLQGMFLYVLLYVDVSIESFCYNYNCFCVYIYNMVHKKEIQPFPWHNVEGKLFTVILSMKIFITLKYQKSV